MPGEELGTGGPATVKDTPPVTRPTDEPPKAITQEDLNKFRSAYDKTIADLSKKLGAAEDASVGLRADIKLLQEGLPEDAAKSIARERGLREREAKAEERDSLLKAAEHTATARELSLEAKASWGIEIAAEELAKLPDRGAMAIFILRQVNTPKPGVKGRPAVPLSQGTPALRYGTANIAQAIEDFLSSQGKP